MNCGFELVDMSDLLWKLTEMTWHEDAVQDLNIVDFSMMEC